MQGCRWNTACEPTLPLHVKNPSQRTAEAQRDERQKGHSMHQNKNLFESHLAVPFSIRPSSHACGCCHECWRLASRKVTHLNHRLNHFSPPLAAARRYPATSSQWADIVHRMLRMFEIVYKCSRRCMNVRHCLKHSQTFQMQTFQIKHGPKVEDLPYLESLDACVSHPVGLKCLRAFMARQHNEEILLFVLTFKKFLNCQGHQERADMVTFAHT